MKRVGMFIDIQNMFYSAKTFYDSRLDFSKLMEIVSKKRTLIRAIAYVVKTPDVDQTGFITMLEKLGYEVKVKDLRVRPYGTKGDWDMGIALDTLAMTDKLDVVVLLTGDGDFTALVETLKTKGVQVEVMSFPKNTADELKEAATKYIPIDESLLIKNELREQKNDSKNNKNFVDTF